jgi:hypothetical protein
MRFFVHSGEATQEVGERYDSATLALEAVSVINQTAPNIRVFNEYGEQVSPADLRQLAAEENESDDA